jgi:hypothetical protein
MAEASSSAWTRHRHCTRSRGSSRHRSFAATCRLLDGAVSPLFDQLTQLFELGEAFRLKASSRVPQTPNTGWHLACPACGCSASQRASVSRASRRCSRALPRQVVRGITTAPRKRTSIVDGTHRDETNVLFDAGICRRKRLCPVPRASSPPRANSPSVESFPQVTVIGSG